jgi:hypothetical protein
MKGKDMYFVISPSGYSGYGETLADSIKDLNEQHETYDLKGLEFYKAQPIKVELREVPTPVEVTKPKTTKKK